MQIKQSNLIDSVNPFTNPNPEVKDLFNYKILPKIIKLLLKYTKKPLDMILCDNRVNTVSCLIENKHNILTEDELSNIKFYIIENHKETYEVQTKIKEEKTKLNSLFDNVTIFFGDYKKILTEKTEEGVFKNKFVYPDTSGNDSSVGGWPKYHNDLIRSNLDTLIIVGTFPVHQKYPCSNLGKHIKENKTIMYEYGIHTIMKTYISINKKLFSEWITKFWDSNHNLVDLEKEDILESVIPDYANIFP